MKSIRHKLCHAIKFLLLGRQTFLIFSIAMGAEYLSYVKSIATFALTFFGYIISVLARVDKMTLCIPVPGGITVILSKLESTYLRN